MIKAGIRSFPPFPCLFTPFLTLLNDRPFPCLFAPYLTIGFHTFYLTTTLPLVSKLLVPTNSSALKTRGNTPKYGLIFHSSFIGRAGSKNKGRISRYLANKCSMASRIDCFSDGPTGNFGEELRSQVEERLSFYESGEAPRKNIDVMRKVIATLGDAAGEGETAPVTPSTDKKKKKKAKRAAGEADASATPSAEATPKSEKKAKKAKKDKADPVSK